MISAVVITWPSSSSCRVSADADEGAQIDPFGLGTEGAHGALLPGNMREGVKVEMFHCVEMGDFVDLGVGEHPSDSD